MRDQEHFSDRRVRWFGSTARLLLIGGLAALVVASAAVAATRGGASGKATVDTLVIANAVKVDTLDPAVNSVEREHLARPRTSTTASSSRMPAAPTLQPDLATSWTISKDGADVHLPPAATHSSRTAPRSRPRTSRYSIVRSKNFKGGWGFLLDAGQERHGARIRRRVVITLSRPHAPLLADLAMYAYAIVPEKLVKAQGAKFFDHPVSSGPFMVTQLNKDSEVDLKVNPHWYGTKPNVKNVKIMIVPNDNSRVLLLQNKNADVIENPPGNLIDQINANPDLQADLFPSTRVDFIQLDEHFAPFKDPKVRQALNYAIDRNAIVKLAYSGHAIAGSSFMPYKMQYWNDSLKPYPYDLGEGEGAAVEVGYPNGFKTLPDRGGE